MLTEHLDPDHRYNVTPCPDSAPTITLTAQDYAFLVEHLQLSAWLLERLASRHVVSAALVTRRAVLLGLTLNVLIAEAEKAGMKVQIAPEITEEIAEREAVKAAQAAKKH